MQNSKPLDPSTPSTSSGLSSLRASSKAQSPEPNYQDELDVYEAVLKLEEKYGKKLLTEGQREKLERAGRDGGGIKLSRELAIKNAYEVVGYLLKKAKNSRGKHFSDSVWNGLNKVQKNDVVEGIFLKEYGIKSKDLGYALFKSFMES